MTIYPDSVQNDTIDLLAQLGRLHWGKLPAVAPAISMSHGIYGDIAMCKAAAVYAELFRRDRKEFEAAVIRRMMDTLQSI